MSRPFPRSMSRPVPVPKVNVKAGLQVKVKAFRSRPKSN